MVTQKSGKQVPVVQAYAYSKYIGKLLLTLNANGDVVRAEGNTILLNSSIGKGAKNPLSIRVQRVFTIRSADYYVRLQNDKFYV